jgi:hypothetical protein
VWAAFWAAGIGTIQEFDCSGVGLYNRLALSSTAQPILVGEHLNMRHLELRAAWVLGIGLPLLEVARRRTNFHPIASYIDDFIGGGLLIWAATATQRRLPYGRFLLCGAWGIMCGGLYASFFGQIERASPTDVSGLPNEYVVLAKGVLFAVSMFALVLSVRHSYKET